MIEEMYEWYMSLFDDVDEETASSSRRAFISLVDQVTSTDQGNVIHLPSGLSPMERYYSGLEWQKDVMWRSTTGGSKWERIGKPGLEMGLTAWTVLNIWNPSGKIASAINMGLKEGMYDELGEWVSSQ